MPFSPFILLFFLADLTCPDFRRITFRSHHQSPQSGPNRIVGFSYIFFNKCSH